MHGLIFNECGGRLCECVLADLSFLFVVWRFVYSYTQACVCMCWCERWSGYFSVTAWQFIRICLHGPEVFIRQSRNMQRQGCKVAIRQAKWRCGPSIYQLLGDHHTHTHPHMHSFSAYVSCLYSLSALSFRVQTDWPYSEVAAEHKN